MDYRVHVVGNEFFASEVISDADEYRYPEQHNVGVRACRLPYALEDRCRKASKVMQLPVAGIDLRQTPEGDWYCFEVNPSPAFTYYENRTDQPIGKAIARLLATGSRSTPEPNMVKKKLPLQVLQRGGKKSACSIEEVVDDKYSPGSLKCFHRASDNCVCTGHVKVAGADELPVWRG